MAEHQLYSRQSSTYGGKMMGHIMSLKIHIIGNGPLAFECAKNLILSGVQYLSFESSSELVTDCTQNFAFVEKHVQRISKVDALIQFLKQLNPRSNINSKALLVKDNWKEDCDILIVTTDENIKSEWIEWNNKCREQNIWYIVGSIDNFHKCAFCWQDPGESHQIWDTDGEKNKDIMIVDSKQESELIFKIKVGTLQHNLSVGDLIKSSFWNSNGKVCSVQQSEIKIEFDSIEQNVKSGIYITRIPHTTIVNGITLDEYISRDFEDTYNYHFYGKCGRSFKHIWEHFWHTDSSIFNSAKSSTPWYPLISQIGGIMAQEAMKSIGKFTPLVGAYYADCQEIIPDLKPFKPIEEMTVFVVGAGALGCEALKNLVMMGFGKGEHGKIIVTDMDSIELSNLSRQFLYREKDIGQLKSIVASQAIKEQCSETNIEAYTIAVGKDSLETFNDEFWNSLDFVVNALDNIEARTFVDSQCIWYKKPLFESGTLGMKGNTQIIIPDHTQTYSDSRDPPSEDVPVCTIKHYPYQQSHCIQWAREMFETLFGQSVEKDKHVTEKDSEGDEDDDSTEVDITTLSPEELFQKWFIKDIQRLHDKHPRDSTNEDGTPFWGGQRRFPSPYTDSSYVKEWSALTLKLLQSKEESGVNISFEKDEDSNGHIQWITLSSNARAFNYDIPQCSFQECKEIAGNITPAVATITSVVMGFVFDEIMKYVYHVEPTKYCNTFLNLGINMILMSEPMEAIRQEGKEWDSLLACATRTFSGETFTCWDNLCINAESNQIHTVQDLCDYLESTYNVEVTTLYSTTKILYNDINPKTTSYLQTLIKKEDSNLPYTIFVDAEDIDDDISVLFPIVKVQ